MPRTSAGTAGLATSARPSWPYAVWQAWLLQRWRLQTPCFLHRIVASEVQGVQTRRRWHGARVYVYCINWFTANDLMCTTAAGDERVRVRTCMIPSKLHRSHRCQSRQSCARSHTICVMNLLRLDYCAD